VFAVLIAAKVLFWLITAAWYVATVELLVAVTTYTFVVYADENITFPSVELADTQPQFNLNLLGRYVNPLAAFVYEPKLTVLVNVAVLANVTVLENFTLETTLAKKLPIVTFLVAGLPVGSVTITNRSELATDVAAVRSVIL
jgi:hypothetical protein